jgi:hypothetical protein
VAVALRSLAERSAWSRNNGERDNGERDNGEVVVLFTGWDPAASGTGGWNAGSFAVRVARAVPEVRVVAFDADAGFALLNPAGTVTAVEAYLVQMGGVLAGWYPAARVPDLGKGGEVVVPEGADTGIDGDGIQLPDLPAGLYPAGSAETGTHTGIEGGSGPAVTSPPAGIVPVESPGQRPGSDGSLPGGPVTDRSVFMLRSVQWGPGVPLVGVAGLWRGQPDGGLALLRAGMGRLEWLAGVEVRPAQEVDVDASALWEHFRSAVGPMRDAIAGLTEEPQRRVLNAVLDQFDELLQSYDQVSGRLVRRVSVDGNPSVATLLEAG